MSSYDSIRFSVSKALDEASNWLKEAFDRGKCSLQQGVREAVRVAAEST